MNAQAKSRPKPLAQPFLRITDLPEASSSIRAVDFNQSREMSTGQNQLVRSGAKRPPIVSSTPYRTPQRRQQINPQASYTQSRTWVSPRLQAGSQASRGSRQLNESRKKMCPSSPFWTVDFNLQQHRLDWKSGELRHEQLLKDIKKKEEEQHRVLGEPLTNNRNNEPHVAFSGQPLFTAGPILLDREDYMGVPLVMGGPFGTVNGETTVFCEDWEEGKANEEDFAPWPNKHEMEYEGEGRIATDRLHRRCLPLPRVECNTTVNWQQRALVKPHRFEDFYLIGDSPLPWYNPLGLRWEDIFFRIWRVPEFEFTNDFGKIDEDGQHALGAELVAALDPQGHWA